MAAHVTDLGGPVVEVGPGTGAITRALLDRGVSAEHLYLIERDPAMADYLQHRFPRTRVMCGDGAQTSTLLQSRGVRSVRTVVSGLPLRNLPSRQRKAVLLSMMEVLESGGHLLQFTYGSGCPVHAASLGLRAECLGRVWCNLPPAAVWKFSRFS